MAVIVRDTFTAADGTALIGRTTEVGGKVWSTYVAQTWQITANRAAPVSQAWDHPVYVDAGVSDNVAFSITCADYISSTQQIFWRIVDDINSFCIQGTTIYSIYDNAWYQAGTIPSAFVTGDVVRIEVVGNISTIFRNGTQIAQIDSPDHTTGTGYGFNTNNTATRFDNFTVETLGGEINPIVQTVTSSAQTGNNVQVTVPAVGAGNTLLVFLNANHGSGTITVSDSRGNAYTKRAEIMNGTLYMKLAAFSAVANATGDVIITGNYSSSNRTLLMTVVEVTRIGDFDTSGTVINATTSPTITTAEDGFLFAAFANQDALTAHTYTPGAGYTELSNLVVNNTYQLVEYQKTTAAGSYNATVGMTGDTQFSHPVAMILAFKSGVKHYQLTFQETVTLTDSMTKRTSRFKTFSENVTMTDSKSKLVRKTKADSVTNSDSVVPVKGTRKFKSFSENVSLTDAMTRKTTYRKTFSETVTMTDSIRKRITKAFTETVVPADTVKKVIEMVRQEFVSLTDQSSKSVRFEIDEVIVTTDVLADIKIRPIIAKIHLTGEKHLYVYLTGQKEDEHRMDINLEGGS